MIFPSQNEATHPKVHQTSRNNAPEFLLYFRDYLQHNGVKISFFHQKYEKKRKNVFSLQKIKKKNEITGFSSFIANPSEKKKETLVSLANEFEFQWLSVEQNGDFSSSYGFLDFIFKILFLYNKRTCIRRGHDSKRKVLYFVYSFCLKMSRDY